MNWTQLETNWKEFAGSARAHWSKLSNDDWKTINGQQDHLVGCIQARYDVAKEDAQKQVDNWSSALQDISPAAKAH